MAYQPRGEISDNNTMDPLADPAACARDAPMMAKLGTNVLRVYEVGKIYTLKSLSFIKLFFSQGGPKEQPRRLYEII